MLINWFTVSAQIVNFIVLVILLKFFLYDKIIAGMDNRENEIKARFDAAENKEKEAQQVKEDTAREKAEFNSQKEEMLAHAKNQADKKKKILMDDAEQEIKSIKSDWLESLEKDRASFLDELRRLASRQVYALAGKIVRDLGDSDLNELISNQFLLKLNDLDEDKRQKLSSSAAKDQNIIIKSGAELSKELQENITRRLHEQTNTHCSIRYETDAGMMPGIELHCSGFEMLWRTQTYLEALEDETQKALDKQKKKLKGQAGSRERDEESGTKSGEENRGDEKP